MTKSSDIQGGNERETGAPKMLRARALFFGAAREAVGEEETWVETPSPATAASVLAQLSETYPALARFGRSLLIAVNLEYAGMNAPVRDGDEIAVFPPVSGGSAEQVASESEQEIDVDWIDLTSVSLDIRDVTRRVSLPECGATVTLDGYVREWTRGRRTLYLHYEAYAPMAISEMRKIARAAREHFEISRVAIAHRTGRMEIGETSVIIAVSAPHRRAAFEACEWLIKELKRTVPIWKKEFYEGGEVWVDGERTSGAPNT